MPTDVVAAAGSVAPSPMVPASTSVLERRVESVDTVTLALAVAGRDLAVEAAPGQFCMLWVPGVGECAISVSGRRADGALEHTVKTVGAVTRALCAARPGDVLGLRGPFGRGWDLDAAGPTDDLVVVGGGIGLAPLRPVVHEAQARIADGRLGRAVVVIGARTPADLLYADELDAWCADERLEVCTTVDRAPTGWRGDVGVVTRVLARLAVAPARTHAAVCGPEVMLRATARALIDAGVPGEAVQVSLERNMRCGIGHCGHCQLGPHLLCRDGPVHRWSDVAGLLEVREL